MGWRAWDHYESEARARWKALPWRERYDWRSLLVVIAIAVAAVAFFYASIARGAPIGTSDVHVIDGDTIRVFHKGPNVRHYQTNPNNTQTDNYGTRGNINPYTGAVGTRSPRY